MNRLRTYVDKYASPVVVDTWMQNQCIKCGRFLGIYEKKFCRRCANKDKLEYNRKRYQDIIKSNPHYSRDNNRRRRGFPKGTKWSG